MNKKLLSAFAAAAATISTPALAADAYTLKDNNGYTVSVLEVTQSEINEIAEPILDSQDQKPGMTMEEVQKQRAFYNAYLRDKLIAVAKKNGYDDDRSRSLGMGLSDLAGRYYLRADASLAFGPTEYNPTVKAPINGSSPGSVSGFSRTRAGEPYKTCGILMSDKGYDASAWYTGFTGQKIENGVLPEGYSEFFRENAQWVERTDCFFVDSKMQSEYIGARQLLNAHYGQNDMEAVIEFVNFYADSYAYAVSTGYMQGEDLNLVGAAIRAAVEDFKAQDKKLEASDIFTMIEDKKLLTEKRLNAIIEKEDEAAVKRQKLFVAEHGIPKIETPAMEIKVSFSGM